MVGGAACGKALKAHGGTFEEQCEGPSVVEDTLEGGRGWTLDLVSRTWGRHAKVLSIGMTGSDECFF